MIVREISVNDADFMASAIDLGFTDGWNKNMILSAFNGGRFTGFIAEKDGKPIGFITYSIGYDDADIESVFVAPNFRKTGVAKKLIEETLQKIDRNKILLEVKEGNLPAIKLYEKFGFITISVRKKYYADGSNAFVMQKELSYSK